MSRNAVIGLAAFLLALVALVADYFLGGADLDDVSAETDDIVAVVVLGAVAAAAAAFLFGRVVPRAEAATDGNRPAKAGLVTAAVAALMALVPWLGLVYVVAPAALVLGLAGRERAPREGRSRAATAATAVGALALLLGLVAIFSDTL